MASLIPTIILEKEPTPTSVKKIGTIMRCTPMEAILLTTMLVLSKRQPQLKFQVIEVIRTVRILTHGETIN